MSPLDTSQRDFAGSPVAATRPASALAVRQLLIVALAINFGGKQGAAQSSGIIAGGAGDLYRLGARAALKEGRMP